MVEEGTVGHTLAVERGTPWLSGAALAVESGLFSCELMPSRFSCVLRRPYCVPRAVQGPIFLRAGMKEVNPFDLATDSAANGLGL